jgi:hypothetical protein
LGRIAHAALTALVVIAVAMVVGGCRRSDHPKVTAAAKSRFVNSADEICSEHLQAMLSLLGRQERGNQWRRGATRNEGIYRIMATSIQRLEELGTAPDPHGDAFRSYVKTLKARASLYRLAGVAELHRDAVFALQMEKRVAQIDSVGDGYAQSYGLRICGIGAREATKGLGA